MIPVKLSKSKKRRIAICLKSKIKSKRKSPEHDFQASVFDYVDKTLPALRPYMFAIPNGGHRHIAVAKKMKAEGVTPGIFDIFISIPNLIAHGLYIECKAGKNDLSDEQIAFRDRMKEIGYWCEECRTIDDFIVILENYFGLERLSNKEIVSRIGCEKFIQKNHGLSETGIF
jgi:hypothetical protein